MMANAETREPWLRGTLQEIPAVHRAVLHSFQMAEEDLSRWCGELSLGEWNMRPGGVAGVAFHVRHIARSVDRLLTYAEGGTLNEEQTAKIETEGAQCTAIDKELAELHSAFKNAARRVRALIGEDLEAARAVGRELLPTSLGGLLVHVAEHTQRHVGQAITTVKLVRAARVG